MKIISNNDCYIQREDIDYLINNNKEIPSSIFNDFNNSEDGFVKISDEESKEYIINSDIPSFYDLYNMDEKMLKHLIFKIKISMIDDSSSQKMSEEELKQVILEEKNRRYMLKQLLEIIRYKKMESTLKYPDIPHPNKLSVTNGVTNASHSLNFGNVLIYNLDGSSVSNKEDMDFCNIAYKLLMHDYFDTENIELEKIYKDNYLLLKNKNKKMIKKL